MNKNRKFKVVSLFSGGGGLDVGLERAGFETVSMCEYEARFCATLAANKGWRHCDGFEYFNRAKVFNSDVRDLLGADLARNRRIDLVVGGPPCQSFSSAGNQKSVLDKRGQLVNEFIRIVDELHPSAFLFENVRGLVTARDSSGRPGGVIENIHRQFEAIGYSCRAGLLNAADYGAFQRRVRCFILGVRFGKAPDLPTPTHADNSRGGDRLFALSDWRTLGEFLDKHSDEDKAKFTFPTEGLRAQLEALPDGTGLKSKGRAEPTRPGGHWGYRQGTFIADQSKPARTVTGSASQDWVRRDGLLRRITILEALQLQGFPKDWSFEGTKSQIFKQIGNAVPVVFGEVLGKTLLDYLENHDGSPPEFLDLPKQFHAYIQYTKRDHERNKSARQVHLQFKDA